MSDRAGELCAAYGCPLLGVYGVSGKWFCCCHFGANPGLNDAITLELHRQKPMVDQVLALRRAGQASKDLESRLVEIIREIGQQAPLAPVTGPTHAEPHFSETDS